jgi:hypothetical protein
VSSPTRAGTGPSRSEPAFRWLTPFKAAHELSGAIYGTLVASAVLATEGSTRDSVLEIALVVLVTLVVYWFAHGYADMLAVRARDGAAGGQPNALADLGHALRREFSIVGGSASLLGVLLLSSVFGAGTSTAVDIAVWFAVLELLLWGILAARAAELRGWHMVAYGFGSACLGLVIGILQVLLH